ncbi:MAG: hypothetical protein LUG92_01460 [Oscillospiraceae bacterium]|nr:hypothetical protein [Oscillospiraceae bacterium]
MQISFFIFIFLLIKYFALVGTVSRGACGGVFLSGGAKQKALSRKHVFRVPWDKTVLHPAVPPKLPKGRLLRTFNNWCAPRVTGAVPVSCYLLSLSAALAGPFAKGSAAAFPSSAALLELCAEATYSRSQVYHIKIYFILNFRRRQE